MTKSELVGSVIPDYGMMPAALPEEDRDRWAAMTAAQRRRASDRLEAIEGWNRGTIPIETALASTGLSRSRFYRMAAEWRSTPSLATLGTFAGTGGTKSKFDGPVINALQAAVAKVVADNPGETVTRLVELMLAEVKVEGKLPGISKRRAIVEDELRRVASTGEAGNIVMLDCTAVNLPREDGRPFALFALLDKGTRVILGAAIAEDAAGADGYRRVAIDALARLETLESSLPWAVRTKEIDIALGTDVEGSARVVDQLKARVHTNVQPSSASRRFGKYFRTVVGLRIGRVEITPLRTEDGLATPDNGDMTPWTLEEAGETLRLAVEQYNEPLLQELSGRAGGRVPDDLAAALKILAA
ncbi:hypothetical protein [Sphingomonas yabuuchiae]|uniref:hypothetical protein n=1 Tax=Sphingomonas yabuuchiae TaxID=172044 RepID=UPI003D95C3B1